MSEAREALAAIQKRADAGAQTWEVGRGKFNTETNGEYIDALLATDVPRLAAALTAALDLADHWAELAARFPEASYAASASEGHANAIREVITAELRALADEHLTTPKEDD